MRFLYEYRTSDNVKHDGEVVASNREAAYALLKAQGIRPGALVEAPGFFNKLFGKGKRWIAIVVLAIAAVVSLGYAFRMRQGVRFSAYQFDSPTRRQLIGDAAVIEKGIKTGWFDVFDDTGDRFLAGFAIPGVPVAVRNTSVEEIVGALRREVPVSVDDPIEVRQIKAIVAGMKDEIRALQKDGWTIKEVGTALVNRQEKEIGFYNRAKNELENARRRNLPEPELTALWERKNDELRNMGIKLVPLPE